MAPGSSPQSLDQLDLKILSVLREDGRISKVQLAKAIGLSPTPCSMRIDRLEAARFIRGYHAEIDVERLGNLSQFIVTVSIKDCTPEKSRQFEAILSESINIVECDAVFGSIDYVMRIFAQNVRHYHEIMAPFLVMEIDYTTYPISKNVNDRASLDLLQMIGAAS
ncbi:Lrp/AsnC family transcriptional regulator [Sphingomonas sp. LaA6.9]|uniref:Lrp/AsnC family transcriptional regulator n=1 Tax=Sphingomonas sp. LaA6.9 TaxID=2919914 RepID=UPI001F4F5892|nr:Lrp/AsnC family transcriptional regulator [Sphingomonas sp. LaA6.9]MCJ8156580.1 Lrp/AsnC family transcriptional regulator [Sphingomonas sp. LaA6.9]